MMARLVVATAMTPGEATTSLTAPWLMVATPIAPRLVDGRRTRFASVPVAVDVPYAPPVVTPGRLGAAVAVDVPADVPASAPTPSRMPAASASAEAMPASEPAPRKFAVDPEIEMTVPDSAPAPGSVPAKRSWLTASSLRTSPPWATAPVATWPSAWFSK